MYELLGISLILAALLAGNTLASCAVSLLWRGLAPRVGDWSAAARAQLLFALRVLPGLLALGCALLVLLPAYVAHEPSHSGERVSLKLALLALFSAAGLLLALGRGLAAWRATQRLLDNWAPHATKIAIAELPIPAYRLQHQHPLLAVAGVRRPRLFISEQLLATLSPAELAAVLAHERAHLLARDNLKRMLLRGCRDVLTLAPCGRALDRAWLAASEEAADDYAARGGAQAALELAAALVKVARLAPAGVKLPALVNASSIVGADTASFTLAQRVQRLLHWAEQPAPHNVGQMNFIYWLALACLPAGGLLLAANTHWLQAVHHFLELAVAALQ